MLRFYAEKFHAATHMLSGLSAFIQSTENDVVDIDETAALEMVEILSGLSTILEELNLLVSKKSVDFIHEKLRTKPVIDETLRFIIEHLYRTINDELSVAVFFYLKPENAKFYDQQEPLFGLEADTAFPSSSFDIKEAGRCLALGRSTACVMHLMRALETPLKIMAADLGVTLKRDNWGTALGDIEKKILALNPKTDADKKEFHSSAAVQFRFFKDAWRDGSMHARSKYGDEEADEILRAVKAFMRHLAKRIKE